MICWIVGAVVLINLAALFFGRMLALNGRGPIPNPRRLAATGQREDRAS